MIIPKGTRMTVVLRDGSEYTGVVTKSDSSGIEFDGGPDAYREDMERLRRVNQQILDTLEVLGQL